MSALSNFRMSMSEYEFGDSEVGKYELSMSKENLPTSGLNTCSRQFFKEIHYKNGKMALRQRKFIHYNEISITRGFIISEFFNM